MNKASSRVSGVRGQVIGLVLTAYALHLPGTQYEFSGLAHRYPGKRAFGELTRLATADYSTVGQFTTHGGYLRYVWFYTLRDLFNAILHRNNVFESSRTNYLRCAERGRANDTIHRIIGCGQFVHTFDCVKRAWRMEFAC